MDNVKELAEMKQRSASNTHRLDNHDDDFKEVWSEIKEIRDEIKQMYNLNTELKLLTQTVASVVDMQDTTNKKLDMVQRDIADTKNAPHKNKAQTMDRIFWLVGSIVITGLAAFVLNALAPNVF